MRRRNCVMLSGSFREPRPTPKGPAWYTARGIPGMLVVTLIFVGNARAGEPSPSLFERQMSVPAWMFDSFLEVQAGEGPGLRRGYATLETPKNIAERVDPKMA